MVIDNRRSLDVSGLAGLLWLGSKLGMVLLLALFLIFFEGGGRSFADPLPAIELKASNEYTNWVGCGGMGSSSSTGSSSQVTNSSNTPKNGQSLGGVAGTGFTQAEIDKAKSYGHGSFKSGGSGWLATTYGPPWDSVEGGGETSTGLKLEGKDNGHGRPRYEVAVDPNVIPYGSLVTVWPNAVGWHGAFLAADTGGAINGHHVDVYDWSGDGTKDSFSANNAKVEPYTGSTDSTGTGQAAPDSFDASFSTGGCCSSSPDTSQDSSPGNMDISQIAKKYDLQSAIIEEQGGNTIASYHANDPPNTPASTMKLIIADVILRSHLSFDRHVAVTSDIYYGGSNDIGVSSITIGDALDKMLNGSKNVAANALMKALGGVSSFTQKAHGYGYTGTAVNGYYSPANDGKNKSIVSDQADAMNHILSGSGSNYGKVQNLLQVAAQNDNYYKVDDTANKWGATSAVASNVGNFKVNGKDYIIGLYINKAVTPTNNNDIKNASKDLAASIRGGSTSQTPSSSTGQTGCCDSTSDNVPAGTLPSFIPEPYNGAFTKGANNHNVAPALIAALFSEEHNLGGSETSPNTSTLPRSWAQFVKSQPNPNSGWASSSAGASGPFQFLPSTFASLGYDVSKINNLVTSADAAAKYAQTDGATKDKPTSSWKNFIFSYNHADWYVTAVLKYYSYYNSQPQSTPGSPTTVSDSSSGNSGDCSGSVNGQSVADIAKQELSAWKSGSMKPGFRASNSNSFSKYSHSRDELWCADFVSWVYDKAGVPLRSGDWNISYVPDLETLAKRGDKLHWHTQGDGYKPQPGDIAIYGGSHTNILVSVDGSKTTYIGGDQGGGPYPDGSVVSSEIGNGYYSNGITGYATLN